jgi:hypothetical protein
LPLAVFHSVLPFFISFSSENVQIKLSKIEQKFLLINCCPGLTSFQLF